MDSKEIMMALANIHNRLCDIQVRGEQSLPLSDCIRGLRKLLEDMNKAQAPTECSNDPV